MKISKNRCVASVHIIAMGFNPIIQAIDLNAGLQKSIEPAAPEEISKMIS